jgi:D-alanyl-D-alanine carboxypeptidase
MRKTSLTVLLLALFTVNLAGCGGVKTINSDKPSPTSSTLASQGTSIPSTTSNSVPATEPTNATKPNPTDNPPQTNDKTGNSKELQVVAKPDSITVLVNKQFALPQGYKPNDLVYPNVPFTFKEKIEKRMMRKEAAQALEQLFAGAKKDGINLVGVSAYRSYATQTAVFSNYVKKDGETNARTYSALPGTSEHETGLAIDVAGSDGRCAAQDCFAGTKEAKWLDQHSAEYGFILRYIKGKESITGYQYEPWHIRYVGTKLAKELAKKGITLEEYDHAVPVSK